VDSTWERTEPEQVKTVGGGVVKWKPTSDYHAVSECGRYHISRVINSGGSWYDGWFGNSHGQGADSSKMAAHIYGSREKRKVLRALEIHNDKQQLVAA